MEAKIKKRKSKKRPGERLSDFGICIVSFVLAVIVWFTLSITQFPTINKTVKNVPVIFSMDGTAANDKGLRALNYQDFTVDVELKGRNYEIGTYTANDLVATVNLENVTKEGSYDLDISVKSTHSADMISVESISPPSVEVKFDYIESISMEVTPLANNVSAEDGYILQNVYSSPGAIEIQGAANDLDKIASVCAVCNDRLTLSEDATVSSSRLVYYDDEGNELDPNLFTPSTDHTDIIFTIYKKVTLDLMPEFTNVPPGFDLNSLKYDLSQEKIIISTPQLDADPVASRKLNSVSLHDITVNRHSFNTDVNSLLSANEIKQTGVDQIQLDLDMTDYAQTKALIVKAKNIELINVPLGMKASLDNEQISGVIMIGPEAKIDALKDSQLKAIIDLSDITTTGSFSHEVTVYSEKYNDIWNIGTHEAVVTVSER